ncbi:NAD(P)/FAD-dependent oxidoreductase [Chryseoglobus sp. 28M-23]|uniref:phytoene desaturase family protein n=1 Tax=Chryseoglobus sp. 28M-23 TaxID=2772253 RepID=UPI001746DC2D|nr:NAD(P)/FAD-dependent oxidoreductase [Chryseoglobus sp. 28M-23]QOD94277.1 NAD(P)/FAD-dependent oxidoreductase [Chryseoglobus sp. 28M-23]
MAPHAASIVGSGPNGLAAAVILARAGIQTTVYERSTHVGGGARTAELTLPGYRHDVGSAVHPLAVSSGFFRRFQLDKRVELRTPERSYGHPLDGRPAAIAYRSLERTAHGLGVDGPAWTRFFAPLVDRAADIAQFTGSSLVRVPDHPIAAALFGLRALEQGSAAWDLRWRGEAAPALLAGVAAHSVQPMPSLGTAGTALSLATAGHAGGWPIPVGGSQAITDALVDDLLAHGGTIEAGAEITSLADLPPSDVVLLDLTPRALERLAGDALPDRYRRLLLDYRYGPGIAKVDFALSGPVPWADPELEKTPTLHLGGTRQAIAASEATVARGQHSADPYVLLSQPSIVDDSRAPAGHHVLWAYTHVPSGSTVDQTEAITRQIERWAPGFRDLILAASSATAAQMEIENPNYIGGDIAAGAATLRQLIARPTLSPEPWRTPVPGLYLCSSATPPGPGVHGLGGAYAARSALRHEFGLHRLPALGIGRGW